MSTFIGECQHSHCRLVHDPVPCDAACRIWTHLKRRRGATPVSSIINERTTVVHFKFLCCSIKGSRYYGSRADRHAAPDILALSMRVLVVLQAWFVMKLLNSRFGMWLYDTARQT
ncbi:hypothetical protein TNCV_3633071 [Trichonephila clavipes]|nr:hypothetical protein TNCV_3633071 [Trichonephila clavipes]